MAATPQAGVDGVTRTGLIVLAAGRLAIGAAVWVGPGPALAALGFRRPGAAEELLARIAGTRDIALGTLQLVSLPDAHRSRVLAYAAAGVDAGDAAAFSLALARGGQRRAAAIGAVAAVGAAVAGSWLAKHLS